MAYMDQWLKKKEQDRKVHRYKIDRKYIVDRE